MISIDQMVSVQPGLIPRATGALTHKSFWAATSLMDHYFEYFYAHFMRATSDEETLWAKEAYEHLESTHWARLCAYREDIGRFTDTQFKETVQTYGQQIR